MYIGYHVSEAVAIIGQIGREIAERCKEHQKCFRLGYPEKSVLAEHSLQKSHEVLFASITVVIRSAFHGESVIQEALEIQMDLNVK